MKFTKEQFEELGNFYTDDLNINSSDQNFMFEVFNLLPRNLQGLAVSCGLSDSDFQYGVFKYLIVQIHNLTVDEYYKLKMYDCETINSDIVLEKLKYMSHKISDIKFDSGKVLTGKALKKPLNTV